MNAFVSINRGFGGAEKQFDRLYADLCARPAMKDRWVYERHDLAQLGWLRCLARLLRIRRRIVVYNMSVLGTGVFFLFMLKALGNLVVLYPHVVVPAAKSRPRLWLLRAVLQRFSLALADHVIMISDGNLFEVERLLKPEKTTVVYNYVECENDRPFSPASMNKEVAVIGRLQDSHKQQLTFLRQHGKFVKEIGLTVHFFGSGPDEQTMLQHVRSHGLERHVIFHGWKDEQAIYDHGFSFVLNLSRWEGLPLSVLESLYRDRIVLASDIHGNRELIYGDFLFKNGSDLRRLLTLMVRDHQVNTELLRAQKRRLYDRCNQDRALATLERLLVRLSQRRNVR